MGQHNNQQSSNFWLTAALSSENRFCDPRILSWSEQVELTSNQSCSECWLKSQALQLNSPFGYDENLATNFAALTSRCGVEEYAFASPTQYALNVSSTATSAAIHMATLLPECTDHYVVKSTDDCHGVAGSLNISTFGLLQANGLDLYCQNFQASVGSRL